MALIDRWFLAYLCHNLERSTSNEIESIFRDLHGVLKTQGIATRERRAKIEDDDEDERRGSEGQKDAARATAEHAEYTESGRENAFVPFRRREPIDETPGVVARLARQC